MCAMRVSSLKRSSLYLMPLSHAWINIALSIFGLVLLNCTNTRRGSEIYFRLFINYIVTYQLSTDGQVGAGAVSGRPPQLFLPTYQRHIRAKMKKFSCPLLAADSLMATVLSLWIMIEFYPEENVLVTAIATLANALLFPVLILFHVNTTKMPKILLWTSVAIIIVQFIQTSFIGVAWHGAKILSK